MTAENFIPKISIIVPMYNVEQYVGECLESILIQTFTDYEVIIVDDCSTDNSCKVVESYMPKFNGNVKLVHTEENSGGCAVPRNVGLTYAKGKYIFFLDSDDLIIKTGLAELYKVADDYQADVVDCEKFYTSDTPKLKGATLTVKSFQISRLVTQPSLDTDDIGKRIKDLYDSRYNWAVWSKLIRRSFIVDNQLTFPLISKYEEFVFTTYCIVCAKRYVRVPNIVNIYRYRPDSNLHAKLNFNDYIREFITSFTKAFSCCQDFLSNIDFFKKNPEFKYMVFNTITQDVFRRFISIYQKIPAAEFDTILRRAFAESGNSSDFAAFFFSLSNLYELRFRHLLNMRQKNMEGIYSEYA